MAEITVDSPRGPTKPSRKVSFRDLMEDLQRSNTIGETKGEVKHTVQISELFPSIEPKSILRKSREPHRSRTKNRHKSPRSSRSEPSPRKKIKRLPGFKYPTETLSHALLRTMSHKATNNQLNLPKLVVIPSEPNPAIEEKRKEKARIKKLFSAKTEFLPDIFTPKPPEKMDSVCGACRRNRKTRAAAGYCKFCEEYLCPNCVQRHKMAVTKTHPVIVFYCNTCKNMNILNRRGSCYCIQCRKFYCSECVLLHCLSSEHDVLEEADLLDVVDVLVTRWPVYPGADLDGGQPNQIN